MSTLFNIKGKLILKGKRGTLQRIVNTIMLSHNLLLLH